MWQALDKVLDQPCLGDVVNRIKIPVHPCVVAHVGRRDIGCHCVRAKSVGQQLCRTCAVRAGTGPAAMSFAVRFGRKRCDAAICQLRIDLNRHRGGIGFPGVFIFARPFEQDRRVRMGQGDDRSLICGVVGTVLAVAAGAGNMGDLDLLRCQAQTVGNRLAQWVDALAVAFHKQAFAGPFRQRRRWRKRAVHLVGAFEPTAEVRGVERFRHRGFLRCAVDHRKALRVFGGQMGKHIGFGQSATGVPSAGQSKPCRRFDNSPLSGAGHRQKTAIAHHMETIPCDPL